MTVEQQIGGARDQFPVGMRVLAVDDDPTCLLVLETLLRRCQYHVTPTCQAVAALKMLRENRNRFDLVISDVHMPDMDGFKLLELVGLEMDLPVIMLSANGDPKLVMKGITHGACDYLLKPIRIEELKNIWQHVIRRRKLDNKDRYNFDNAEKSPPGGSEAKLNKKRKDQNEDEDDQQENEHENDDPTTQKKPRVVWSGDLHRKFVAAVNQLGIDKAVPKKILDLMNVEKLTRENVASHLQKYRLYLKRISTVANQQAHMVAALGSSDASYLQMGSVPGFGFHNAALRSLHSNGILSRLNSPASLGMQLGHMQNSGHFSNAPNHFHQAMQNDGNVLQGMPASLGLDQIQSNKAIGYDATAISVPNSHFLGVPNKPLMLGGNNVAQRTQDRQNFSQLSADSLDSGYKEDGWSTDATQFKQANFYLSDVRARMSEMGLRSVENSSDVSSMPISNSSDVSSMPISNSGQMINNASEGWNDQRLDAIYQPNNSGIHGNGGSLDPNNAVFCRTRSFDSARQPNFFDPSLMRTNDGQNLALEALMRSNDSYGMNQQKNQSSYIPNNFGTLEDITGVIVKQEPDKMTVTDDFGFGLFC